MDLALKKRTSKLRAFLKILCTLSRARGPGGRQEYMVRYKRFTSLRKDPLFLRSFPKDFQRAKTLRIFGSPAVPPGQKHIPVVQGYPTSRVALPQRQPPALFGPGSAEYYKALLQRIIPILGPHLML